MKNLMLTNLMTLSLQCYLKEHIFLDKYLHIDIYTTTYRTCGSRKLGMG
jgi:hypothetical protein